MKKRLIVYAVLIAAILGYVRFVMNWPLTYPLQLARIHFVCGVAHYCHHIDDQTGFVPVDDVPRFEHYMHHIQMESGVDLRFVFVNGTGDKSLEGLAAELVQDLRIGASTSNRRGMLLLYDVPARRLKVEVGYGLEGMFPDVFVSYLMTRHTQAFFESGQASLGLRLLLRLLQQRIRDAVLGDEFDPRALGFIEQGYLSGGAGVAAKMAGQGKWRRGKLSPEERARYAAGDTPLATYLTYMNWLNQPVRDGNVDFFTPGSRSFVSSLPVSQAYNDLILMGEYGKKFALVERGDLAILYFTSTPFTSPHLFTREGGKWRMDLVNEIRNTREFVGTYYTWAYIGTDDRYTVAFRDLLEPWGNTGFSRFKDGDNRMLRVSWEGR